MNDRSEQETEKQAHLKFEKHQNGIPVGFENGETKNNAKCQFYTMFEKVEEAKG